MKRDTPVYQHRRAPDQSRPKEATMAENRIPASESSPSTPITKKTNMKGKNKLPRGIRRRGSSLVVSFAGPDGRLERRSLGPVSLQYAEEQRKIFQRQVREGVYEGHKPRVR